MIFFDKHPRRGYEAVKSLLTAAIVAISFIFQFSGLPSAECIQQITSIKVNVTRRIFQLFKEGRIPKSFLTFLSNSGFINGTLIGYWKVRGYKNLCCIDCIQKKSKRKDAFVCICRLPKNFIVGLVCQHCGCKGCSD